MFRKNQCNSKSWEKLFVSIQTQPSRGVLKKRSPQNMHQIYRKFQSLISIRLLWNFIEIILEHGCSPVNLLLIFRTPFHRNTSGELFLSIYIFPQKFSMVWRKILLNVSKFLNCELIWKLNQFSTNVPLLYSLKTSKNPRFSDVFRGYRSGTLVENRLVDILNHRALTVFSCVLLSLDLKK